MYTCTVLTIVEAVYLNYATTISSPHIFISGLCILCNMSNMLDKKNQQQNYPTQNRPDDSAKIVLNVHISHTVTLIVILDKKYKNNRK